MVSNFKHEPLAFLLQLGHRLITTTARKAFKLHNNYLSTKLLLSGNFDVAFGFHLWHAVPNVEMGTNRKVQQIKSDSRVLGYWQIE